MNRNRDEEFYNALIRRDAKYVGLFFVGVKTTGIFCHAICPSRKPKLENCEFFKTAKEALTSGYRPCKKCKPLSNPTTKAKEIDQLIKAVEEEPEKRWQDQDFKNIGIHSSTARRQFKKYFNMTFVEYARLRRMGIALNEIKSGHKVIEGQQIAGFESGSGFRDGFSKLFGDVPSKAGEMKYLHARWIESPIGSMLAVCDEEALLLLEFIERRGLEMEIKKLRETTKLPIIPSDHTILDQIEEEVKRYFDNDLVHFTTPIKMGGTNFQKKVWHELMQIPYGKTISYKELAHRIGQDTASRAVANANGKNQLAIIIPCHRVIRTGGDLGGYGGGIARKQWLLELEQEGAQAD